MVETISELAAALRTGSVTAEQLLETCLARIAERDGLINSFVLIDEADARAAAGESDQLLAQGKARSPLEGIPISIKDNIHVRGLVTSWGSRGLKDFIAERDELPIARLRQAGVVIVGKTNVPELTLEGYTSNELFGTTRNPWNTDLTPGGSSGGAAASVAAGFVVAAIGTDGGGSIRRPASHTGLVGWKPSPGRIARAFGLPAILTDLEVVGTLTRSVADARLLDGLMAGADNRDRRSLLSEAPAWKGRHPRVLFVPTFGDNPVDPEVLAATQAFADLLANNGADVEHGGLFFDLESVNFIWRVISRAGVAYLERWRGGNLEASLGPSAKSMLEDGRTISAADYVDALERITALRQGLVESFADYDLVLTPTAAALPWPADTPFPASIAGRPAGPRDHAVFTGWINSGGLPAISLPVALSKTGLPIGIQLAAGCGADESLLTFAESISALAPPPPFPKQGSPKAMQPTSPEEPSIVR